MVMSGGGAGDPRDDPDSEKSVVIDCSYQNHTKAIFRKGRHRGSSFRRAILDEADLTEGDFSDCDFRRASMVEADLMKSAFDGADFPVAVTICCQCIPFKCRNGGLRRCGFSFFNIPSRNVMFRFWYSIDTAIYVLWYSH